MTFNTYIAGMHAQHLPPWTTAAYNPHHPYRLVLLVCHAVLYYAVAITTYGPAAPDVY